MAETTMTRRQRPTWLVILVLAATGVASSLQYVLIVPILPVLPEMLGASVADVSWLITATLLAGSVATPILARLADMYGRRRMAVLCMGFIVAGSTLAVFSDSLLPLVIARALSGMSSGIMPINIALMRQELPPQRLGFGIGIISTSFGIGTGVGLPIGGLLYASFGWHSIFLASLVLAAILMVLIPLVVGPSKGVGGRFDLLGAVLLTVALIALLLGVSKGADWGWLSPLTLGSLALALVVAAVWFRYELRVAQPLVDLASAFSRPVLITNVASLLLGLALFGNMVVTSSQLQVPTDSGGLGLDTLQAGIAMLFPGLVVVLVSPLTGLAVQRLGGRLTLIFGSVLFAVGYLERVFLTEGVVEIMVGAIVIQIGMAFTLGAAPAIITRHSPMEQTASAIGVNALVRSIGTAIAAAEIAAAFTLVTTSPSGVEHPTPTAFTITFVVAGTAAVITVLIAFWIPSDRPSPTREGADGDVPA